MTQGNPDEEHSDLPPEGAVQAPLHSDLVGPSEGAIVIPEQIGPYRITGRLGLGGMGIVYSAEQETPRRNVALKVIHPLLATPNALRRFRQESEVLGRLHHPGIAQIFQAGTFDLGSGPQPYFAMELIEGLDLRTHADAKKLDVRGRLALIADVADAVHHAHGKGIVHRDLKPENVLVNGNGQTKVLDFGVAHTGEASSLLQTRITEAGKLIGTLAYMSPEQLSGQAHRVTPRSDIYSIGVIAYELIAGRLPHELAGLPVAAAVRLLSEHDAPPLGRSRPELRGDVDTIIARALQSDPARRYHSAAEFAADIRRHLNYVPITARPATTYYRVSRLIRRNRGLASGLSTAFATLTVGLILAVVLGLKLSAEASSVKRLSALQDYGVLVDAAEDLWPVHADQSAALKAWIEEAEALVQELPRHRAKLMELRELALPQMTEGPVETQEGRTASQQAVHEASDWRFPKTDAGRAARWWHANLSKLITSLEGLQDEKSGLLSSASDAASPEHGWSIPRRLAFVERLREDLAPGTAWSQRWENARKAIQDDPRYRGLDLKPQAGLVPIGPDPRSGLWEFSHMATGDEPERDENGELVLTEGMGAVLVLIPSATFWMGASNDPMAAHNYDRQATAFDGPEHEVSLSAYFLSKYEFTQAQWWRIAGNTSGLYMWRTKTRVDLTTTPMHPMVNLDWFIAKRHLEQVALTLPSEAQWEYGARAGTQTPWWTGQDRESLQDPSAANLADQAASRVKLYSAQGSDWPELNDGFAIHAPIGTFAPNPFGLHEVHGNVSEWCLDGHSGSVGFPSTKLDPVSPWEGTANRIARGASFLGRAFDARISVRSLTPPLQKIDFLGVRPARAISK